MSTSLSWGIWTQGNRLSKNATTSWERCPQVVGRNLFCFSAFDVSRDLSALISHVTSMRINALTPETFLRFRVSFYIQTIQWIGLRDSVYGVTIESGAVLNTKGSSFLETSFWRSHFASLSYNNGWSLVCRRFLVNLGQFFIFSGCLTSITKRDGS